MRSDVPASGSATSIRPRTTAAPPKPWIAALLGVLWPGAGHLYAGEVRRAGVLALITLAALPVLAWSMRGVAAGPVSMWAPMLAFICFRVWVLVDGWRAATRRSDPPWTARRRWVVLLAATAAFTILMDVEFTMVREQVARAVRIPSRSMEPTILSGDYLLISPLVEPVSRGAVVVWRDQRRGGEFVHRVIGLPGDTLRMAGTTLWRNGREVDEPCAQYEGLIDTSASVPLVSEASAGATPSNDAAPPAMRRARQWGPYVVPPDSVFLLGDNRDFSADSRYFGPARLDQVLATPRKVYFSRDPESGAFRWRRFGLEL